MNNGNLSKQNPLLLIKEKIEPMQKHGMRARRKPEAKPDYHDLEG